MGYLAKPNPIPLVTSEQLMAEEKQKTRVGTFILKYRNQIISVLQIDDKNGDGRIASISGVETDPNFQRRGTCWRQLIRPCLFNICFPYFERIEALTWVFNRKGIPFYKRIGFRALPGTSLTMENYIPLILRHPRLGRYFSRYDVIRTLRTKRSYGYDDLVVRGVRVFEYKWDFSGNQLVVYIDFSRKKVMSILPFS